MLSSVVPLTAASVMRIWSSTSTALPSFSWAPFGCCSSELESRRKTCQASRDRRLRTPKVSSCTRRRIARKLLGESASNSTPSKMVSADAPGRVSPTLTSATPGATPERCSASRIAPERERRVRRGFQRRRARYRHAPGARCNHSARRTGQANRYRRASGSVDPGHRASSPRAGPAWKATRAQRYLRPRAPIRPCLPRCCGSPRTARRGTR